MEKEETIILTDEEGKEHRFNLLDVISVDDDEYAVLLPEDDDEAIILKFGVDEDGNETLYDIEDDEEWEKVVDVYQQMDDDEDEE